MGGKTKQGQRTKNNVRPSSSGRSAEMLGNINVDFNALKLNADNLQPSLLPKSPTVGLDQDLTPELQICIKKLNKKDPITKTKALQELCDILKNDKVECALAVLPSWAHFYRILTVDVDRKVREATQACHSALVNACGRQVAPHLKQLLPAWLQALHDEHAPAQALALNSLKNTFPDRKLPEVLAFCKAEVMAHLLDSLTGCADGFTTGKVESVEEKKMEQYRLVRSSLSGLEYFTTQLPGAHDAWLWAQLAPLLAGARYWQLAAHEHEQARAAWFAATGRVLERFGSSLGREHAAGGLRVLLAPARETSSLVAANRWACLLQFMHSVPDWHQYLVKTELLTKRILDVLENGGWGDARHLAALLLPLLAHLPPALRCDRFYRAFFDAILAGLKTKNILTSKCERQAWITGLGECLRYLSIQQEEFAADIVTSVHRSWLREALCAQPEPQVAASLVGCSATNMAALVGYWLRQAGGESPARYELLIRTFWQNIGSTASAQIDKLQTDRDEITQLVEQHVLLFKTLKNSFLQDPKKQQSIKFEMDSEPVEEICPQPTQACDSAEYLRYRHNLDELVHLMCSKYFEFAHTQRISEPIMTPLASLIMEFDDLKLFSCLAGQFGVDSVYKLYDNVLRQWLLEDTMKCRSLVDIVFLMLSHMTEEEQNCAMDSFKQLPAPAAEWGLRAAAERPPRHRDRQRALLRGWARAAPVTELCARLATAGDLSLLLLCLQRDDRGEAVVGEEAAAGAAEALAAALGELRAECAARAARLCAALPAPLLLARCRRLLTQMLLFTCRVPRDDPRLSPETWDEVRSSWRDALALFPGPARLDFLLHVVDTIQQLVADNANDLNINKLENIASLCPYLLSKDSKPPAQDLELASTFTRKLLSLNVKSMEPFALHHDCITANMNCPFEEDNEHLLAIVRDSHRELTKQDVSAYLNGIIFRGLYLKMLLQHKGDEDCDESWCETLLADEHILLEHCKLMHDYAIVRTLFAGYYFWRHHQTLRDCKREVETIIKDIIAASSEASQVLVMRKLSERSATTGYYWAYARRYYELMSGCQIDAEEMLDMPKLSEMVTGNGFIHTMQAMCVGSPDPSAARHCRRLVAVRAFLAAHGPRLRSAPRAALLATVRPDREAADATPTALVNAYFAHNDTMLYDTDVTDKPWSEVVGTASVLDYLTQQVEDDGWNASAHCWDFTTISLCAVFNSLRKSKQSWDSLKVGLVGRAACRLYVAVAQFTRAVPERCEREQPSAQVAHLPSEWADIFAPDLHSSLLDIIAHVIGSDGSRMNSNRAAVLEGLTRCADLMEWNLLSRARRAELSAHELAAACAECARAAQHPGYHYLAHAALVMLAIAMVREDGVKLSKWNEQGDEMEHERPKLSLEYLDGAYQQLQERALAALAACDDLDSETDEGAWEARTCCTGWLLLAEALHCVCAGSAAGGDEEVRAHLAHVYREHGYAGPLLSAALSLLPPALTQLALEEAPPQPQYERMFLSLPPQSALRAARGAVAWAACRTVWVTLAAGGGGAARAWAAAAGPLASRTLHYLVRAYVAPHAVRMQLDHLQAHKHALPGDAEVTIRRACGEVSCEFTVDGRRLELGVAFARDHPLGLPRVTGPAGGASGPAVSTNWLLVYLGYQNGMVASALRLWMRAVNTRVDRAPQCYICYCRLEFSTGQLPRVRCHQCRSKYHAGCLRKWFKTSAKTECPLCRSKF